MADHEHDENPTRKSTPTSTIQFTIVEYFEGDTNPDELDEDIPIHRMNPLQLLLLDEELTCSQD